MDETFLININCSSILLGSRETQYTMFIDSTKLSIVYELVEWIRWVFSIDSCIYLAHENSVIHYLDDIRVLSKLKNLEIKPCGEAFCVHKNTHKTLLNKLNVFVNWGEMKVHRYFLEKLNKINGSILEKNSIISDPVKVTDTSTNHSLIGINFPNSNKRISLEKSGGNPLLNYPLYAKLTPADDLKSEPAAVSTLSFEKNSYDNKKNKEENLLIQFEDISDNSKVTLNSMNGNTVLSTESCDNFSQERNFTSKNSGTEDTTINKPKKSNWKKSSQKSLRPFSLGEILSDIRADIEKQNVDDGLKKSTPLQTSTKKETFDEATTFENVFESKIIRSRKRSRTKKKKKEKNKAEYVPYISPIYRCDLAEKFTNLSPNKNFKPNHIRFDDADGDIIKTDLDEDDWKMKINKEFEIIQEVNEEPAAFGKNEIVNMTDNCQNFMHQEAVSPSECKMENLTVEDKDEVILDGIGDKYMQLQNEDESFGSSISNQDLSLFQSLKEKLKNSVVVNRFY